MYVTEKNKGGGVGWCWKISLGTPLPNNKFCTMGSKWQEESCCCLHLYLTLSRTRICRWIL